MNTVQLKLLAAAKVAGLGLCLVAAPVAVGVHHHVVHHKSKIARVSHPEPQIFRAAEVDCPRTLPSQAKVTYTKWTTTTYGPTPIDEPGIEPPNPVDEPAGLALWLGGLILIGYSWYRGRV